MILENQVCSLELAKKLKELGVEQESYFEWFWYRYTDKRWDIAISEKLKGHADSLRVSAFTVAELGEMLPNSIKIKNQFYYLNIVNGNGVKYIDYITYSEKNRIGTLLRGYPMDDDTEADARAKMLIYLLENNLLTPPKS
jgi:hypothetical protein